MKGKRKKLQEGKGKNVKREEKRFILHHSVDVFSKMKNNGWL